VRMINGLRLVIILQAIGERAQRAMSTARR
jgi:hypothetical protein